MIEYNSKHIPLAYLITFTCYGTWLHGDHRGSVDLKHNHFGDHFLEENVRREQKEFRELKHLPVKLTIPQRKLVTASIICVCEVRGWKIWDVNVRTNHVHVVVSSPELPEKVLRMLKSRSAIDLKNSGTFPLEKVWTRGGSKRYLWKEDAVEAACKYVREQDDKH